MKPVTAEPVLNIVLYEPEIPPNTGNIIRLCANTGMALHMIEPLGFSLDAKSVRRAGLDYREAAQVSTYSDLGTCLKKLQSIHAEARVYAVTTKGELAYHQCSYQRHDILLFGPESRGLPDAVLADPHTSGRIRVPMMPASRSINLANAVSIVSFEALRQMEFPGLV